LQTNQFIKEYISHFPVLIVSFVNSSAMAHHENPDSFCRSGNCSDQSSCVSLDKETHSDPSPDFDNWTPERRTAFRNSCNSFLSSALSAPSEAKKEWPVFAHLYESKFRGIHTRKIISKHSFKVACSCIPGAVRLFCDVDGNYFPCEKVETSEQLRIGNVSAGIDVSKVAEMISYMSSVTNCEVCLGKHLCSICPSSMTQTDLGRPSDKLISKECEVFPDQLRALLTEYTEIM